MSADCEGNSTCPANSTEEDPPVGMEGQGSLKLVFTVLSAVMVGLVMFSFGCSVESRKLWLHLRRPWGIAVGLLCQFGLMPLTAYLLAIGFGLKPFQAIAVLIMGSCPGGTVSNVLTFWVDGDMDLSISMTTCSTVAALGMMPLCLYVYTRSWTLPQSLTIPYQSIGITLVSLVVPVASGIYVNYRWPKQATFILKVRKPLPRTAHHQMQRLKDRTNELWQYSPFLSLAWSSVTPTGPHRLWHLGKRDVPRDRNTRAWHGLRMPGPAPPLGFPQAPVR